MKKFIEFIRSIFNSEKNVDVSDFSYILKFDICKTYFGDKTQIWYIGKPDALNTKVYIDYESAKEYLDSDMFNQIKGYCEVVKCKDGTKHKAIDTMIIHGIIKINADK